jgi:hypothetical protein
MAFQTLRIADVGPLSIDGLRWHPLRHALDVRGFGVNAYSAVAPGDELIEDHDEANPEGGGDQELYVVIAGRARFTIDDEDIDVPAGDVVFLPDPSVRRHAVAEEPGTLVLAVGGDPARPHAVSPWEARFRAVGTFDAGDRERGLAIAREGLAAHPGDASTLYDLACLESRAGEHDAAVGHLREALEARDQIREWAADDTDLDPLRDRPDFPL